MPQSDSLLAQKLRRGGVARSPLPETEVIGETFARMVEDRLRPIVATTLSAMLIETRVLKLAGAIEGIGVPAMLALIDVEDADTQGLICLDTDLTYHLVDLMLGGDPALAPAPTARTFTGIDLALARIPHEALLTAFAGAVSAIIGRPITKRIALGHQYQNVSQLRFAPGYVDVLMFTVALDLGEAARTGNLSLLMPLATLDVIRAAVQGAAAESGRERPDDLWRVQMRRAAAAAPVVVDAVLHRRQFTLAAIQALRPGDMVEVPENAVNEIQLTIAQPGGRRTTIAAGHLGGYRGTKVVRLDVAVDPRLQQHVRSAL